MNPLLTRFSLCIVITLSFSMQAHAQDATGVENNTPESNQENALNIQRPLRDLYWGFRFGQGFANPDINLDSSVFSNDEYTNSVHTAASHGALFVEKQLHPLVHISAGIEANFSQRLFVDKDASANTFSAFLGAGATIGNISKPLSPYFSFMVGPGKTIISDTGDPDAVREPCQTFICFVDYEDKLGASASGISHRVSIGLAVTPRFRVALSQTVIGGDADDLVSGSTAYTRYTNLFISVALR